MTELADSKTEKVAGMIREFHQNPINELLVVGCGDGIEAAILAQQLQARVTGIDVEYNFDERALSCATLQLGDAEALEFESARFDFVYSYHALEHISDPCKALREMHRVLKPGGGFWIGTPNRARMIGYIGAKDASLAEKIRWNLADWKSRAAGKFRNEFSAHAGFTSLELRNLLEAVFSDVTEMTEVYFSTIYAHRPLLAKTRLPSRISRYIYPSVYFTGRK